MGPLLSVSNPPGGAGQGTVKPQLVCVGAMESWGRSFVTCTRCPESWVYLDRIVKRTTCSFCGQAWSQKTLTWEQKQWVKYKKWSNAQSQSWWPPENRNGGWNQAVGQEEEQSGTALAHVWDAIPKDVQSLLEGVGCSPTPAPPPGLSQVGKTGNGKGKGKGKGDLKEKREATKLLWEQATEDQQKLLEAAGLRQPVEAKPELKELCKKFEDSLPVELQEALRALDPRPDPRKELKEANLEYKQATVDLRKLINRKAMLQHEINKAKEGYQALLQSMQDLKVEEKVQQEKVQKLQKTLHERVADGEEESTCEELDLQAAMTSAGVDLTKEQKEALARALGQKPVKVAFAFGLDASKPDRKPGSETGNDRKPRSRSPKRDRMED